MDIFATVFKKEKSTSVECKLLFIFIFMFKHATLFF